MAERLSVKYLLTCWRHVHTRWLRLMAAPDRRRRRRWAGNVRSERGRSVEGCAAARKLLVDGFASCDLHSTIRERLLNDWHALKAVREQRGSVSNGPRSTGKQFFEEALGQEDLGTFPAFLATALDERVLVPVMQAMDMVPHLESIDVLVSAPSGPSLVASQLWHYDVNDERIVKLFVYLEDCGPENGPFTFIPAGPSQSISGALGHYVDDQRIATFVPPGHWRSVEGEAGTAFLIDTGRCYHFGSRCKRPRVAYIATYSSGLKFMSRSRMWGDLVTSGNLSLTPLQLAVCGVRVRGFPSRAGD